MTGAAIYVHKVSGELLTVNATGVAAGAKALRALGYQIQGTPAPVRVDDNLVATVDAEASPTVADSADVVPTPPARSASRAAWAAYAKSLGVDATGLKRDQIREATATVRGGE